MDDPAFYRDDLQAYYDGQLAQERSPKEALAATRKRFKAKGIEVTPTGEVRAPGVTDNPDPPSAPTPPPAPLQPLPGEEKEAEPEPQSQIGGQGGKDEALDTEWLNYLDETNHSIGDFEDWLVDTELATRQRVARWSCPDSPLPSLLEAVKRSAAVAEDPVTYAKFKRLSTMSARQLREHLASPRLAELFERTRSSKLAGLRSATQLGRGVLRLRAVPVSEWSDSDWLKCRAVVHLIERLGASRGADESHSERTRMALMACGCDVDSTHALSESDLSDLIAHDALKALTPHVNGSPVFVYNEEDADDDSKGFIESPHDFKTLKKGRVELTDEERAECMKRDAVWNFHHGRDGKKQKTPAVWKSVVDGVTWYVTNTHRAFNVAKTLDGAIQRYFRFIKSTA